MAHTVKDLLTPKDIQCLLQYMWINDDRTDQRPDVRSKHPRWRIDNWPQHIVEYVLDTVLDYPYIVEEVIFNESIISFRLHVDSGNGDVDRLGDAVLIPLLVEGAGTTVFFDNYWHGVSTRFSRTPILPFEYTIPGIDGHSYYTPDLRELLVEIQRGKVPSQLQHVQDLESIVGYLIEARQGHKISKVDDRTYDYTNVKNFDLARTIDRDIWCQNLTHVPWENFHGLSLDKIIPWTPGDAIVFDRTQIHCAGTGHSRKIAITIFTQRC